MVAADSGRSRRAAATKIPLRTTQAPGNQSTMRLMAFLLLGLLAGQAAAAGLIARVDRTQLSIDETLELSLESQGSTVFGKTDLQSPEPLFEVFDTRDRKCPRLKPSHYCPS